MDSPVTSRGLLHWELNSTLSFRPLSRGRSLYPSNTFPGHHPSSYRTNSRVSGPTYLRFVVRSTPTFPPFPVWLEDLVPFLKLQLEFLPFRYNTNFVPSILVHYLINVEVFLERSTNFLLSTSHSSYNLPRSIGNDKGQRVKSLVFRYLTRPRNTFLSV